jgi:hypothetical protein
MSYSLIYSSLQPISDDFGDLYSLVLSFKRFQKPFSYPVE